MIHLPTFSAHLLLQELREHAEVTLDPAGRLILRFKDETVSTPEVLTEVQRHHDDLCRLIRDEITPMAAAPADRAPFGSKIAERQRRDAAEQAAIGEARRLIQGLRAAGHAVRLSGEGRISITPRPDPATAEKCIGMKSLLLDLLAREVAETEEAGR